MPGRFPGDSHESHLPLPVRNTMYGTTWFQINDYVADATSSKNKSRCRHINRENDTSSALQKDAASVRGCDDVPENGKIAMMLPTPRFVSTALSNQPNRCNAIENIQGVDSKWV
jgi:hypothetical protein